MSYTIKIPWVPPQFATKWHPTSETGPFSVLQRGVFEDKASAISWAKENLAGTPYRVEEIA